MSPDGTSSDLAPGGAALGAEVLELGLGGLELDRTLHVGHERHRRTILALEISTGLNRDGQVPIRRKVVDLVRATVLARVDAGPADILVADLGHDPKGVAHVRAGRRLRDDDHAGHGAVVGVFQARIDSGPGGGAGGGAEERECCDDWLHGISQKKVVTDEPTFVDPSGCPYGTGAGLIAFRIRDRQPQCSSKLASTALPARLTPFAASVAPMSTAECRPVRSRA